MQNYLVYLAYPDVHAINECRYALLQYLSVYNLKPPASTKVVVYTDKPMLLEAFASYIENFEMLPVGDLQPLTEPLTQTRVLQTFSKTHSGNILYCNAATYPVQPLEPLFKIIDQGKAIVTRRADITNEVLARLHRYNHIKSSHVNGQMGDLAAAGILNTSVVGMQAGHRSLLEEAALREETLSAHSTQVVDVNMIWSDALQHTDVDFAVGYFVDYCGLNEFRKLLQVFFQKNQEESIPNQVKLIHHVNAAAIAQEKLKYDGLPLYKKWMNVVMGKGWNIKQYERRF